MKAVIFDRDGIIIDSESINIDSAIKAFQRLGISIEEQEKDWIVGRHPDDYKELFLKKYKFSYENFKKIQSEIYFDFFKSIPHFDKMISFIKELKKIKTPIALTTSSTLESTLEVLKNTDLEDVFDVIVTFDDCKKRKPDPGPYKATAKKLGLKPEECIVIEDSFIGVESAKKAGMKCIAFPNEYTKNQDFSKADLVVHSIDQIKEELIALAIYSK